MTGRISFYNQKKFFGWISITQELGGKDDLTVDNVFFHASAVLNQGSIQFNAPCTFEMGNHRGRECARNIIVSSEGAVNAPAVQGHTDGKL
jgi:cold shock CspA family protein